MDWLVNGQLFSGNIVTVGTGKDYATLGAAQGAMLSETLFLIYPGTYGASQVNYISHFRGMGASYTDVVLSSIYQDADHNSTYEWLTVSGFLGSALGFGGMLTLNKCQLLNSNACLPPWTNIGGRSGVKVRRNFRHVGCSGTNPLVCSDGTVDRAQYLFGAGGVFVPLATFDVGLSSVSKCVGKALYAVTSSNYLYYYDFTFGGYTGGTSLIVNDYVATPTLGYGPDYGGLLIRQTGIVPLVMDYKRMG